MTKTAHHPSEVLAELLEVIGASSPELARQLGVPANRITQIINGNRGVTGDSPLRLAHWFRIHRSSGRTSSHGATCSLQRLSGGNLSIFSPLHWPFEAMRPTVKRMKNCVGKDS